eukprot:TRINITY_DN12205_c0_g1_i1.p1 TRINITY_DN12205_c0_g1~~TRINITY_DN12205_c0_g1_i1.p1  ORF type:complete len:513 (+),score=137.48 TRINITY_DN12205_c0_g1_i1:132-1670(+)
MNCIVEAISEVLSTMWTEVVMVMLAAAIYMAFSARPVAKPASKKPSSLLAAQALAAAPASPVASKSSGSPPAAAPAAARARSTAMSRALASQQPPVVHSKAAVSGSSGASWQPARAAEDVAPSVGSMPTQSSSNLVTKIRMLSQRRDVAGLWTVWQDLRRPSSRINAVVFGCMIDALVSNRLTDDAWELVRQLQKDVDQQGVVNTVTYTTLLKGFTASREANKVMSVYNEMRSQNIACNVITYNTILNAFAQSGAMTLASQIWQDMRSAEMPVDPDLVSYSTLIKGYASSGDMKRAYEVFKDLKSDPSKAPDEVLYNSLLDGCARERRVKEALQLMEEMQESGVVPSNYTLTIMVKLLGRSKMLKQAYDLVDTVRERYGVQPNVQVYTCLISACFQCRQTKKGVALLDRMLDEGLKPDDKAFEVIIRGCRQAGQTSLAEEVERRAASFRVSGKVASKVVTVRAEDERSAAAGPPGTWKRSGSSADSSCVSTDCSSASGSSSDEEDSASTVTA